MMKKNNVKIKGGGFNFANNRDLQIKIENIDIEDGSIDVVKNDNILFDANNVNISKAEKSKKSCFSKIIIGIVIAVISGLILKYVF